MSFTEILLLKRLGLGILSFTGALVVLLGGWILISAMQKPDAATLSSIEDSAPKIDRQPDSIGPIEATEIKPIISGEKMTSTKVETVALGCLKDGTRAELTSVANQVRIKANLCGQKISGLTKSSLVNRANGFEATLFNLKNGQFTSDYVALAEGLNSIFVQVESDNGERTVAEVAILRPKPLRPSERAQPSQMVKPAASSKPASETHF